MSKSGTRKIKKQDPELVEFVENFQNELEVRSAEFKQSISGFWPKQEAKMLADIEEVGQTLDLNMTVADYFASKMAGAVQIAPDENQEPIQPQRQQKIKKEEEPRPPIGAAGTPRVDAMLPGGEHLRVPAVIRPKIVEGVFNLRQPKPNEIAFSLNGTPLQMTSRVKEEQTEEEPMEYAECD